MFRKGLLSILPVSLALLAGGGQPWKDKAISEWNDDDTHLVLNDSPWAKTVQPSLDNTNNGQRQSRGMGRGGGINLGGIGIGIPGMGGMGRRGGMGYPGGGYPGGQPDGNGGSTAGSSQPPPLHLRWESALAVRAAELKAREANAPTLDESHYAIAVYGAPDRMVVGSSQSLASQLKKQAVIKRDGKRDLKPSSVDVLQRQDGPVIVYLFPRSKEITRQDKRLEFDAQIGKLRFTESFFVDDMMYQGKLDL
ncbi:MAG TPA: hypothetical protein VE959_08585 [Bryobacteraceae bacterium]|nr:hypothetical protein [Bryobacteraceae bacterium]